jgi:hypothetical protein
VLRTGVVIVSLCAKQHRDGKIMALKSSVQGAFDFRIPRTGRLRGSTSFDRPREPPRPACCRWGKAAVHLLPPVGSLAALLVLFWLLTLGVDRLMDWA